MLTNIKRSLSLDPRSLALYRALMGLVVMAYVVYRLPDLTNFYTDIGRYLRQLEEVIILTLAGYGIEADRSPGETGVWIEPTVKGRERKICAMGVRCSRWITMHGFALNVNTDLSYFDYIIPCGIQNKKVTSIEAELGRAVPLGEVKEKLKQSFATVFGVEFLDMARCEYSLTVNPAL